MRGSARVGDGQFTAVGSSVHATVSRQGVVYARGASVPAAGGGTLLVLTDRRPLRHGSYTLTLRTRRGERRCVQIMLV